MVLFRETASCSRIRRMAHSLTDAGITGGGIVISGGAKAIRHFETFRPPSLIGVQTCVLIHGRLMLMS